MKIYKDIDNIKIDRRSVIAFGKFDGLHLGHQSLIRKVNQIRDNSDEELESVVIILACRHELLSCDDVLKKLEELGTDIAIILPLDEKLRAMSAEKFLTEILIGKLKAGYIVAGEDVRFGYQGLGDKDFLIKHEKKYCYKFVKIEKEIYKDDIISSTRIKECIDNGNTLDAKTMLG